MSPKQSRCSESQQTTTSTIFIKIHSMFEGISRKILFEENSKKYLKSDYFIGNSLTDVKCPHCGKAQTGKPEKSWSYGKVQVQRFQCKCSKLFNYYKTEKNSWTIPKSKKH